MRERPIIFSVPMIRAVLDGKKTQTRRIMNPQPPSVEGVRAKSGSDYHLSDRGATGIWRVIGPVWAVRDLMAGDPVDARARADVGPQWRCPYGVVGDQLWVKEAFTHITGNGIRVHYRADGEPIDGDGRPLPTDPGTRRWMSGMFMPRKLSRITLEIVEVRVQRLQAITTLDAMAEGVEPRANAAGVVSYTTGFRWLWDEINGARRRREYLSLGEPGYMLGGKPWRIVIDTSARWEANPWVWALTFKRAEDRR